MCKIDPELYHTFLAASYVASEKQLRIYTIQGALIACLCQLTHNLASLVLPN